jgi:hypothetical protein
MDPVDFFKQNKYVYISNLVSPELTSFIYNYLVIKACTNREFSDSGNSGDEEYIRKCYADLNIETLSTFLQDKISTITQKKLCPTYTYSRVYTTGEILKPHMDRPSCEYSITLNFGGDPWSIYMGEPNKDRDLDNGYSIKGEILLKPGDGVVYMGEELVHWRNKFQGDHCAQAFLHYIDMDGSHYPEWAYDKRKNIGYLKT